MGRLRFGPHMLVEVNIRLRSTASGELGFLATARRECVEPQASLQSIVVEPEPAEMAERHGAGRPVLDWRQVRQPPVELV